MSTSSYSLIQKLLQFQNSFINLVHSQILSFTQPQPIKQALLKFQILRMGDKNQAFNDMVSTLKKQLIEEKQQADPVLKNYFTKILDLDFLPLLHINRYQLTKLAIFGFDIYIDPLEAILQILNRLQRTFYILQESFKDHSQQYLLVRQKSPWQILVSGWSSYYIYLNFYKLSLNIYMLKEYIQVAGTSLFKKDKEIIFTGVYNFYKKLIPRLIQMEQNQFLEELADLNNTMYSFHGSFDYFLFYTCLKPRSKFIKVYDRVKDLQRKCKATNILTPLLFGILNNYKAFAQFINQVETPDYIHLLRVLLSGLVINFKLRILEYDQVLELIGATITKLNLLKGMKFQIITGDLGKEWRQAKDFFISAFKSGYSVGEIQTWNLCEAENIQPKIRNYLTLGTLLQENCKYDNFIKSLDKGQLEQILSSQISQLTSGAQTLNSLTNNWKKSLFGETLPDESKCLNIIRIINLLNVLENFSQKILYAICSAMIEIKCENSLLNQVLNESAQTINSMVTIINRKQSISNFKYILPQFHKRFTPKGTFQDIVPVYLHCFIVKEALQNLLDVIERIQKQKISSYVKQILTSVIQKYCPRPQHKLQTLKNFEKEYKVPEEIVYMDSQITSVFTNLTKLVSASQGNKLQIASEILINLLRYCPWYVISVMNLPSLIDEKIQSFLSWLVKSQNPNSNVILTQMLQLIQQFALSKQSGDLKQYLQECFYFSVLDIVLNNLSQLTSQQKWCQKSQNNDIIISLVELFVTIEREFLFNSQKQQHQHNSHNVLQKIWYSLLELISFILKNDQFSISRIQKCCNLYWVIIKILKKETINDWYTKILINIIFSPVSSQSLYSSDVFKGISLISSEKNYMISKEMQAKNSQLQRDSVSERFNFSQIKQFIEENYQPIKSQDVKSSDCLQSELNSFNELTQKSTENKAPIKISSIHLSNDKEILPTMSKEFLNQLYSLYCQNENNRSSIEFCLNLLKMNSSNHQILWKLAKNHQKAQFLDRLSFTRDSIGQIFTIMAKIQTNHSETDTQENPLVKMLNFELLSKNVNELELLASSFYFQSSKIQIFLNKKNILWFLIICNNSNWREFNEVFSNYLKSKNFISTLLQYKEFISITKKSSNDYEDEVKEFTSILKSYVFYIEKKIDLIKLLKQADSEKQNEIRKSTLLLNIKLMLLKCQFQKVFERMLTIGKLLNQNSLESSQFQSLISVMHQLNNLCNILTQKNVALPDFSHHNRYMNQNSEESQFLLGRWLQDVQNLFTDEKVSNYSTSKEVYAVEENLNDFLVDKIDENQNQTMRVLAKDVNQEDCHVSYLEFKQNLKDLLQSQNEQISVISKPQIQITSSTKSKFYRLGHLLYFQHKRSNQNLQENLQKVSPILKHLIKRETLPLELLKQADSSSYHHLKLVLMNEKTLESSENLNESSKLQTTSQIQTRQNQNNKKNYFIWREKELIEKGQNIQVTSNNKSHYIELIAEQLLGKNYLLLNKAFALGYLNALRFQTA